MAYTDVATNETSIKTKKSKAVPKKEIEFVEGEAILSPRTRPIVLLWRSRQAWVRAKNKLVLQGKGMCRAGGREKSEASKLFDDILKTFRKAIAADAKKDSKQEKTFAIYDRVVVPEYQDEATFDLLMRMKPLMLSIVEFLPEIESAEAKAEMLTREYFPEVAEWVDSIKGVTAKYGLMAIIGEAGDLSYYKDITDPVTGKTRYGWAALRKRMGIGLIESGLAQRLVRDKELAIEMGYSPSRRSTMWVTGDGLIKNNKDGVYRTLYDRYKADQIAKFTANGVKVCPAAQIKVTDVDKGTHISDGHIHKRAQRYMEGKYLKHLWFTWHNLVPAVD